jgi:S-formylglutathione hydrolase FrmB
VAELGIAVIMPCVHRSFYTDMSRGYRYFTFISEELPALARSFFPLSDRREDNFVAGLSMGGYGAFKLAMRCPEKFAAGASLSGALDIANTTHGDEEYNNIFGDIENLRGSENDLFFLAEKLAASDGEKPQLYQCCGTEDFLYEDNIRFREHCKNLNLKLTYEEEKGIHEWGYWDKKIQSVLRWLPLREKNCCNK